MAVLLRGSDRAGLRSERASCAATSAFERRRKESAWANTTTPPGYSSKKPAPVIRAGSGRPEAITLEALRQIYSERREPRVCNLQDFGQLPVLKSMARTLP